MIAICLILSPAAHAKRLGRARRVRDVYNSCPSRLCFCLHVLIIFQDYDLIERTIRVARPHSLSLLDKQPLVGPADWQRVATQDSRRIAARPPGARRAGCFSPVAQCRDRYRLARRIAANRASSGTPVRPKRVGRGAPDRPGPTRAPAVPRRSTPASSTQCIQCSGHIRDIPEGEMDGL